MLVNHSHIALILQVITVMLYGTVVFGQTIDPLDFFPHTPGDRREYIDTQDGRLFLVQSILRDSAGDHGDIWIEYTNHQQATMRTWYYIDSSYNVFAQISPSTPPDRRFPYLLYKLDAKLGETWKIYPQHGNGPDTAYEARVIDIYPSQYFGVPTTVKAIEYYQYREHDTASVEIYYLASGLGRIWIGSRQSGGAWLSGAIIGGKSYGSLVSGVEADPQLSDPDVLTVYPNPTANGSVIVSWKPSPGAGTITVSDILGRQITEIPVPRSAGTYLLDISGVPSGTYIVTMDVGGEPSACRFIVP